MPEICDLEPFRYDAESVDPVDVTAGVEKAANEYYGTMGGSILTGFVQFDPPKPQATNSINNGNLEGYLNRFREAVCTDITAIEARLAALEAP